MIFMCMPYGFAIGVIINFFRNFWNNLKSCFPENLEPYLCRQDVLEPKMTRVMHPSLLQRVQSATPFMVQGLRTNTYDPDSHVVYFDTEALIGMFIFMVLLFVVLYFIHYFRTLVTLKC